MEQFARSRQADGVDAALAALTVCVCTNRVARARTQLLRITETFRAAASALFVIDGRYDCAGLADTLRELGVRGQIEQMVQAPGLSECRNHALRTTQTRFLLFIDDDALPEVEALREAAWELASGAVVVGARLVVCADVRFPWFITHGQYHLLGVHSPHSCDTPIWGAFLGVDTVFAARHALLFSRELGRARGGLQSGDDSSFVRLVCANGGAARVLRCNAVTHDFCTSRLTMRYLLRRSWWQGRSEVRRHSVMVGLVKEVRRNLAAPRSVVGMITGAMCIVGVCAGVVFEKAVAWYRRS